MALAPGEQLSGGKVVDSDQREVVAAVAPGGGSLPVAGSVTVSNFPATQAVSAAVLPLPVGAAQDGTDGTAPPAIPGTGIRGWLRSIYEKLSGTLAVSGTFWQATQPVSAAALPLPAGAATDASLTNGTLRVGGTTAVSGTFWQATQPVSAVSLPLPSGAATDSTLTNGNLRVGGTVAVTGTFFQATQPVSAVSLPLPAGAATDASLTSGALRVGGTTAVAEQTMTEVLLEMRRQTVLLALAFNMDVPSALDADAVTFTEEAGR